MKKSYEVKELFENDVFIGYFLKADFVAEHEWGISRILDKFGICSKTIEEQVMNKSFFSRYKLGFQTNKKSAVLNMQKTKNGFYLFTPFSYMELPYQEEIFTDYGSGAWDSRNFIIFSETDKYFNELLFAEKNKDLTITLDMASDSPFDNGGLYILIKSRLPKETIEKRLESDKKTVTLYQRMKETKIVEILEKSGKEYYALMPRLDEEDNLLFWLNPRNQKDYNYGWFSVKDLIDWSNDKGPVVENLKK